jgi:hypothetical protein
LVGKPGCTCRLCCAVAGGFVEKVIVVAFPIKASVELVASPVDKVGVGYWDAGGGFSIRGPSARRGAGRCVGAAHVHADIDGAGFTAKVVAVVEDLLGLSGRVAF